MRAYQNVTGGGLGQLSSMLMQGVQFIQQVEAPHKRELENLAVDLVVEEMETSFLLCKKYYAN